jgi:hypothetical protein
MLFRALGLCWGASQKSPSSGGGLEGCHVRFTGIDFAQLTKSRKGVQDYFPACHHNTHVTGGFNEFPILESLSALVSRARFQLALAVSAVP